DYGIDFDDHEQPTKAFSLDYGIDFDDHEQPIKA
ncbi:hypothetical protein CCACVL1_25551, partial [Corchorus capsularis]